MKITLDGQQKGGPFRVDVLELGNIPEDEYRLSIKIEDGIAVRICIEDLLRAIKALDNR